MANSVDPDQTAPIGAVCSGSTLFTSILNSSLMLGNYLQQTTSADDNFRCIVFLSFKGQNLRMLGIFSCFLSSADFFIVTFFEKLFQEYHPSWTQIRPDVLQRCSQHYTSSQRVYM